MIIQILVDNPNSWVMPFAIRLKEKIEGKNIFCYLIHKHSDIKKGDILILLSCEKILRDLSLNKHNLVIHASALPKGKGWSPLAWQILDDINLIPITLFEAADKVDAGIIYYRDFIYLDGSELIDELRERLGNKCNEMIMKFIDECNNIKGTPQEGKSTFYKKRNTESSKLEVSKTLAEQFSLLRVVDNEKYPAFFYYRNNKYILKIYKA